MEIYHHRRQQLIQQLLPNSVVIIPGAREILRNGDTHYPFRQDSDFYYLSGFSEPESIAVLQIKSKDEAKYLLFVRPNDPTQELWNGKRAGIEGACSEFGADEAYLISEFPSKLADLLRDQQAIYYPLGKYLWFDELLMSQTQKLRESLGKSASLPKAMYDLGSLISEMRLFKSPEEIILMQRAADISVSAHIFGMQRCKPMMFEYELAAEYLYVFSKEGASGPAYPSIVAAGANACTLHYTENQAQMRESDLVLVDAGAEYQYYGADITRTFPINGRFAGEQKAIYEIVLAAQLAVINALKPGVEFRASQDICTRVLTEGLVSLGLLKGDIDNLLEQKAYLPFYMHGCSHWLGLDTHDVGAYKLKDKWRLLAPNMVLTVEPGIYIRPETQVDERWHNIGVRIEDDVLITQTRCEVLTKGVPKTIAEIERVMQ